MNCCHPGAVATNMGVDRTTGFGKTITGMLKPFFLTPEDGARTAIFLATDESVKDITGEYFYRCKIGDMNMRTYLGKVSFANRIFALLLALSLVMSSFLLWSVKTHAEDQKMSAIKKYYGEYHKNI